MDHKFQIITYLIQPAIYCTLPYLTPTKMHNTFFTLQCFYLMSDERSVHKYLCTVSPVTRIGKKGNPNFGKNRNLNALDAIIVFQLCSQKGPWSMFQF